MAEAPTWGSQLRQALADPSRARLLLTWGAWVCADWTVLIAAGVLAFQVGGAAGIGLIGAARVLPGALLAGFAALATDRLPRPRVLAVGQALLCTTSIALVGLALSRAALAPLMIVIGIGSVLATVVKTTVFAVVPQVVQTPGELIVVNSAMSTVEALGTVLGPVVCAILLSLGGAPAALTVPAVAFALGALAARSITTAFRPPRQVGTDGWRRAVEPLLGFPELVRPRVRNVTGLSMMQVIMRGLLNVFVVVLAITTLGGESQAGVLFAAIGVGGLVAALVVLGTAPTSTIRWYAVGIALWGLPVVAIGLWPSTVVAWASLAVVGVGNALVDIFGRTQLSRLFRDQVAGRAWGAYASAVAGGVAIGSLVAPVLVQRFGAPTAMVITGTVLALAPLATWPWLRRLQRPVDTELIALLGGVELLAPLPVLVLERLADASREVQLSDDEFAVREGELGDRFYVVVTGTMSVQRQGRPVRTLGRGDGFGEIALLRDVPRTASVASIGPSTLRSIDRSSFMAAVTGHVEASQTAHSTADRWLHHDAADDRADPPGAR